MPPFTSFSSMLSLPRRRLLTSLNPRYKPQPWALTPKHPRYLSTTPVLQKKEKKSKPAAELESKSSKNAATSEDPSDLTAVQDGIARAVSRLKDDLSKLRSGGRFNTEAIETLRVQVSKESKETARLGELAQVVPRGGRMITVLVSEQDHIKPITSAIVGSDLSLTPQPDPHNPLQLNVPIPPPTKESRDQSVQMARQAWEKAAGAIRDSRGSMHKHLQTLEKKKIARGDDVRKAHDRMEKLVEKGQKEAKELLELAKKGLEKA